MISYCVYYFFIIYAEVLCYHFCGYRSMGEIGVVQIFLIKTQVSDVVVENIFTGSSVKIVEQRSNLRLVKIVPVFFRKVKS